MYRHRRRNQVVAVVLALITSAIGGVLISQGGSDASSSTIAAQQVLNHPVFGQLFWLIVIAGLLGLAAAALFSGNDRYR